MNIVDDAMGSYLYLKGVQRQLRVKYFLFLSFFLVLFLSFCFLSKIEFYNSLFPPPKSLFPLFD